VSNVAFSPDGQTLSSGYKGSEGGEIVLWPVGLEACLDEAGRIANRNLSREEWQRYFAGTPYRPTFERLPVPADEETAQPDHPSADGSDTDENNRSRSNIDELNSAGSSP
jgi:hypothetical protein